MFVPALFRGSKKQSKLNKNTCDTVNKQGVLIFFLFLCTCKASKLLLFRPTNTQVLGNNKSYEGRYK